MHPRVATPSELAAFPTLKIKTDSNLVPVMYRTINPDTIMRYDTTVLIENTTHPKVRARVT